MFLIFDTETTGLPKDWNAPITDLDNWPRVVQLAWQIHDSEGKLIEVQDYIVYPDGFDIPKKSKNGKEVSVTFEVPGVYYYWCTPHKGMGMIGLVVVGDDTSNKDEIAKAKALGKSKKKLKKLLEDL